MDIDPVETTTENSNETTTHIKTDTIKLQKRLHKKIDTKDNPTEQETTNPTKKMKPKLHLQKVDVNQKEKNQKPTQIPL